MITISSLAITVPNTPAYPNNSFKSTSAPGAKDGTEIIASIMNDLYGTREAILKKAGVLPSGNADTALASDVLDALEIIMELKKDFIVTAKATPTNAVSMSGGWSSNPNNPSAPPVKILPTAIDGTTFPTLNTEGNIRTDLIVIKRDTATLERYPGVETASPTPAVYPDSDFYEVISEIDIRSHVAVEITNDDIRNVRNSSNVPGKFGRTLLMGRLDENGVATLNQNGGSGASFSSQRTSSGVYKITLSGITGYSNIRITAWNGPVASHTPRVKFVSDKDIETGNGGPTGFQIVTTSLLDLTGGGVGTLTEGRTDMPTLFVIEGID